MQAVLLKSVPLEPLDKIFCTPEGYVKPLPLEKILEVPHNDFLCWCVNKGVYQYPTLELLQWLRSFIGSRSAIEIGAGNGSFGRSLEIPTTDSFVQTTPEMQLYYKLCGQTPTAPPPDVEKLEALEAVHKYNPQVVFGTFITHLYQDGDVDGSFVGVEEEKIIQHPSVEHYVMIGNLKTHKNKRILKLPHEELSFPWLISRAMTPELNRIFIWKKSYTQLEIREQE